MSGFLSADERFLGLPDAHADPERAGVVLLPVPFEVSSSYGRGSANGPDAILEASHQVEFFDAYLGFEPGKRCGGIVTAPPLDVSGIDGADVAKRLTVEAGRHLAAGKKVVTLGGEHTSIVGAVRAHVSRRPELTVLQIAAHSDLRGEFEGSRWNHACAMARILDFHAKVVQVGIRSQDKEERAISVERGLPVFYGEAIHDLESSGADWVGRVLETIPGPVYLTFDLDGLDPGVMPATGTPEPGGLTWRQVNQLLSRLCREKELIGFDVSELAPIPGVHHPQFTAAKLIYRLIGYQFASRPKSA